MATNPVPITLTTPGTGSFTLPAPTSNVTAYINNSNVTAGGEVTVLSGLNNPDSQDTAVPTDDTNPNGTTMPGNQQVQLAMPQANVSVTANAIHFASPDGLMTGEQVVYHNGGGTSIGGLTDGQTYYVIVADSYTIKLAATYADAVATIPVPIDLTSVGTAGGQSQTFTPINRSAG